MQRQWKDLFNEKYELNENSVKYQIKSPIMILDEHFKSTGSSVHVLEKIPQSVIKKSKKNAYKNNN